MLVVVSGIPFQGIWFDDMAGTLLLLFTRRRRPRLRGGAPPSPTSAKRKGPCILLAALSVPVVEPPRRICETYGRIGLLRGYGNLRSYWTTTRLWKLTVVLYYYGAIETYSRLGLLRSYGNLQSYFDSNYQFQALWIRSSRSGSRGPTAPPRGRCCWIRNIDNRIVILHSKRVEKMENTLEMSGEDQTSACSSSHSPCSLTLWGGEAGGSVALECETRKTYLPHSFWV